MPRKRSTLARACAGLVALLISTPSAALSMSEPAAGESATRSGSPLYLSRAQAVETARTLEREAARATDRDRAISLLERAFSVRVHVGPKGQALRDLQTIERLYAAGDDDGRVSAEDQARAADAYWRRRDILLTHANGERDGAALRRHALGYLARHGEAGGIDRALLANLVIAERDWLRSCPKPGLAGLCVTWQPGESVAAAAARASIIEPSKRRLEEALRAKLRREPRRR